MRGGNDTGLAPAWVRELDEAGGRVSWEWKDYIYFVGVLCQMGIDANVLVLPYEKELVYPTRTPWYGESAPAALQAPWTRTQPKTSCAATSNERQTAAGAPQSGTAAV